MDYEKQYEIEQEEIETLGGPGLLDTVESMGQLASLIGGCGLAHFSDCVAEEVVAPDSDSIIGQHLWWPIFCGDDGAGGRVGQQVQQSLTVENTHIHRHTLLQCKNINWFSSYIFLHSLGTGDTLPQSLCLLAATFSV